MNTKYLILCSAILCTAAAGYSQENKGKISSEVVSVEKGYNPDVKVGKKVNFSPDETPENNTKLPVSYKSEADVPQFDFAVQQVSALVMSGSQPATLYPNYIKGGIGYNLSTVLEGYYSKSWGKTTLSAGLNHDRAERDISFFKDNSVFNHSDASVSAKYAARRYDLGGYAKYAYDAFTNNGMRLSDNYFSELPLVLRHNSITGGIFMRSNSGYRLFDHLNIEASYMNGANKTRDSYVKATAGFYLPIKKVMLSLDAAVAYYSNKAVNVPYSIYPSTGPIVGYEMERLKTDFGHFMLTPAVSYKNDRLDLYAGARMELITGNHIDSKFHIMPEIKAAYSIIDGLMSIYGRLESGYQIQNMATLMYDNPFASPLTSAFYSREKFKAQIGLSGVFSSSFRYDVSAAYGQTDKAPAWINFRQTMGSEFLSYYVPIEDDIKVFTLKASGDYTINPFHRVGAFVEYNNSSSDLFSKALYRPDFRIGASYQGSVVRNLIDLSGRIAYNSSSKACVAYLAGGAAEHNMDGYVEFQASAAYRFASRWSLFAEANNTIDGRVAKFYGYDWCGVRAFVGVKFNF